MKSVKLTHAEITKFYDSTDVIREFKTEKGNTIISFNVKTKVNDKIDKSPVVFDRCSMFVDNAETMTFLRKTITEGARVEVSGVAEKNKGKDGKYYDGIKVLTVVPYDSSTKPSESSTQATEEDLPF